jgi:hypothetical protein
MGWNKELITWIGSGIISIILFNLGTRLIEQDKYISLITILISFILLYLTYYSFQIKINEERTKEIKEWIDNKEELLNTMKDIIILKKVSKIK